MQIMFSRIVLRYTKAIRHRVFCCSSALLSWGRIIDVLVYESNRPCLCLCFCCCLCTRCLCLCRLSRIFCSSDCYVKIVDRFACVVAFVCSCLGIFHKFYFSSSCCLFYCLCKRSYRFLIAIIDDVNIDVILNIWLVYSGWWRCFCCEKYDYGSVKSLAGSKI